MNGFYVTTAIPYVNAAPHLGHALELVQADVLARHRRRRGRPVRFLTGTDDNALKNVTAARAAGVAVPAFVAAGADRFAALREPLSLSFDDFIRTSADPRHRRGVEALWRRCAPDLYRRRYEGRYCAGCEQFYAPAELSEGRCPEHGTEPEHVAEENWFFRLSRYAGVIEDAIASGRVRVEPRTRRNEVLAFVRSGLEDISVSRPAARAGGWGIPVPDDPEQVVYVWWDALANYVTALDTEDALDEWWLRSAERVHVVGKGIVRFHAVHWLALLTAVGLPLPTAVFVHPYLTVDGAKISKSAGTGVDPVELVARFGVDAVRWWLLREASGQADTDFTVARLVDRADRELAGGLGNLVQRLVVLAHRVGGGWLVRGDDAPGEVAAAAAALPRRIDDALARFDLRGATEAIWSFVEVANRVLERERPWERTAQDRDAVLAGLVDACRVAVGECLPFLPDGAAHLLARLGEGEAVGPAGPVFRRLALVANGTSAPERVNAGVTSG
jgi:methionyl-tRNA synthetase